MNQTTPSQSPPRIVLVTDPMCSWCWGMDADFAQARRRYAGEIHFELMLGGINVHGTQPIGQYGRRFLARLWREVSETTGVSFGELYAGDYVHNSVLPCLALQAMKTLREDAVFDCLEKLQQAFFLEGVNITDRDELAQLVSAFGVDMRAYNKLLDDPAQLEILRFQFNAAQTYGTSALPSVLVDPSRPPSGELRLLAGGYVDAGMLGALIDEALAQGQQAQPDG